MGLPQTHQSEVDGGEEDRDPGEEIVVAGVVEDRVEGESGEGGVREGEEDLGDGSVGAGYGLLVVNRWDDEGEEKKNNEDGCDRQRLASAIGTVPLGVPGDEERHGGGEDSEEQARPWFEADQRYCCDVDGKDIGEEEYFVIAAGREQQRRGEGPGQGIGGQEFAVLRPGHEGVPRSDQDHSREGDPGGQEVVKLKGGPEGEIESSAADGFE